MASQIRDPLHHPLRKGIYDHLRSVGAERLCDLVRRFMSSRNTIEYHLFIMRRRRLVTHDGQFWRLPSRAVTPEDAARHGTRGVILTLVRDRSLQTVGELSKALGLHPSHVMYHVRALERIGLLASQKVGRRRIVSSVVLVPPQTAPKVITLDEA